MLVVDATVALFAASSTGGFESLDDSVLVAPPLMWSEALSVLHETLWRRQISAELARRTRDRILAAPVERRQSQALLRGAWDVAQQFGWAKTYDGEYVALARELDCPLVTLDGRLRRRAGQVVTVVGPGEL